MARVGVTGLGPKAFRDRVVEKLLEDGASVDDAMAVLAESEEVNADMYASSDYRRHLARIHGARALKLALSRAS